MRHKFKNPSLGESLFLLSYPLFVLGILRLGKPYIHYGDAFHLSIVLHCIGHLFGGRNWGGLALVKRFKSVFNRTSALVVIYVSWALVWGLVGLFRHWGFHTGDFDVGIFSQVLMNIAEGKGFVQQIQGTDSFLNDHQMFLLPIFAPFFWTPWGVELLLLTQPFFLFGPGIALAIWIKRQKRDLPHFQVWAWVVLLSWLQCAPVIRNTFWEWHETVMTVPLLSLWAWAMGTGKLRVFLAAGVLAGMAKENLLITLLPGILIYLCLHREELLRAPLRSWVPMVASALLLHLGIFYVDSQILSQVNYSLIRYSYLGETPGDIIKNFMFEPSLWISKIAEDSRQIFLWDTVRHTGYSALFSGWMTLSWVPIFLSHAISTKPQQYSTFYHYVLEFWPVMSIAGMFFWFRVQQTFDFKKRKIPTSAWPILSLILVSWPMTEHPAKRLMWVWPDAIDNHSVVTDLRKAIRSLDDRCPGRLSGVASQWVLPQIVRDANLFPYQDYEVMSKRKRFRDEFLSDQAIHTRCNFIIGQAEDEPKLLPKIRGEYTKIKTFKVRSWGNYINYDLYLRQPRERGSI